ncbi:MAG: hypothetical protein J6328_00030 [Bacilli bacterium]|nr:hypothetical protein [Bacilli bacterium]
MDNRKVILQRGVAGLFISLISSLVVLGITALAFLLIFASGEPLNAITVIMLSVFSVFGLYMFVSFIETLCCPKIIITSVEDGLFIKGRFYRFDEITSVRSSSWWNQYGQFKCGYLTVKTIDKRYVFGIVSGVHKAEDEINLLLAKANNANSGREIY